MKDAILLELARRWELDASEPGVESGLPEHQRTTGVAKGHREAKRECADTLRTLVGILGDEEK